MNVEVMGARRESSGRNRKGREMKCESKKGNRK